MPGGDNTGPQGQGPMSGRGAGWCAGSGMSGYTNRFRGSFFGRGFGFGGGRGFGMNRGSGFRKRMAGPFHPYATPNAGQNEAEILRREAQDLETSLEQIKSRLTQLESEEQSPKDE